MKLTNQLDEQQQLTRMVWLAFTAVLLLAASFGGYYYFDRYVHVSDPSPVAESTSLLETTVRQNPDDVEARVTLAQNYMQSGRYQEAIEQAGQVLEAFPSDHGALFVQGLAYAKAGQADDSIEPLARLVVLRRQSPMAQTDNTLETALFFLGQSYLTVGSNDYAIDAFTEALTINRTDADALYLLGVAYSQNGQAELALAQYQNAVRFVPDFAEAYQGMADCYQQLGQPDHLLYAQGMVAYAKHDVAVAQQHFESAVDSLPDFVPALLGLGLTYEQLGQLDVAQSFLERAVVLEPDNFLATHALGRVQHLLTENG
ncbi:MAG: tetratricopeptide repeat protein [Anaerolineales bacterium]|nr:tetratricopeptide repeat protein [Anaerolineales bacterium]